MGFFSSNEQKWLRIDFTDNVNKKYSFWNLLKNAFTYALNVICLTLAVAASMTQASTSGYKGYDRSFCVRMKSTLTKRGCHFKSSGYRVSDKIF